MQPGNRNEQLEESVRKIMRSAVPGLSIIVVGAKGTQWVRAFGFSDIAARRLATEHTVYMWFSMTKMVTATCVLQLVESGQIGLDDAVAEHYEPFRILRPSHWAESVTVRHLLNHTSGLKNPVPITWIHKPDQPGPPPGAFLNNLLHKNSRIRSEPGSTARYSNLNYLVLGELIASVSRQDYRDYVRQRVLKPLRMERTDFVMTPEMGQLAATAYQKRWAWATPALRVLLPGWVFGDPADGFFALNRIYVDGAAYGGLIGSAEDAAKFLRAHLNFGEVEGTRLLTADSVTLMQTVTAHGPALDVGLGWLRSRNSDEYLEHLGGGGGYFNVMRIYPSSFIGIVIMGNSTSYDHNAILKSIKDHLWDGKHS
jgi:CubicO group peptidase (beta-lactamase class C family)